MEIHETHEKIHEAVHAHSNTRVAILISILAALLAISEMGGKSAQHASLANNIAANDLWAFFQAKTIRMTVVKTAADMIDTMRPEDLSPERRAAYDKQVAAWRANAERYESDPQGGDGRKELATRAKAAEEARDHALGAYHLLEYASASFQIAIVLASASLVAGVSALALVAGGLGVVGTVLSLLGWFAPTLLHP